MSNLSKHPHLRLIADNSGQIPEDRIIDAAARSKFSRDFRMITSPPPMYYSVPPTYFAIKWGSSDFVLRTDPFFDYGVFKDKNPFYETSAYLLSLQYQP